MIGGNSEINGRYSQTAFSSAALAANTALQIVAPGSNTKGVELLAADFNWYGVAGGIPGIGFVAHTAAPTALGQGDHLVGSDFHFISGAYGVGGSLKQKIVIPPGKGLYFISSGALTANAGAMSCVYRVL